MSFCLRLRPGIDPGRLGGKARSLLRLATAGLPVPEALVVTSELFAAQRAGGPPLPAELPRGRALEAGTLATIRTVAAALGARAWPAGVVEELTGGLHDLDPSPGARFAVRSSASVEDRAGALAAGLFLSRLEVPRDAVAGGGPRGARVGGDAGGRRLSGAARAHHRRARILRADPPLRRRRRGGDRRVGSGSADFAARRSALRRRPPGARAAAGGAAPARRRARRRGGRVGGHRRPADLPAAAPVSERARHRAGRGRRSERPLALGRGPQPAAAVAGAGGPGRAGGRALPDRLSTAGQGRISVLRR